MDFFREYCVALFVNEAPEIEFYYNRFSWKDKPILFSAVFPREQIAFWLSE